MYVEPAPLYYNSDCVCMFRVIIIIVSDYCYN